MMHIMRLLPLFLTVALLSGCYEVQSPTPQRYRADVDGLRQVGKIAIMPFDRGPAPQESADLLRHTLQSELARRYDVVEYARTPDAVEDEQTVVDELLHARDATGADAALLGKIISYRRFDPPMVNMDLTLVSIEDGTVLWSAAGVVDAARPEVAEKVKNYFARTQEAERSLFGWRTVLVCERRYVQFAANEFLLTMSHQGRH